MVYATFPDTGSARRAAGRLVGSHLAACCNLLPQMQAVYWWEGAVQEHAETVLLAKTTAALSEAAMAAIRSEHPYGNPAVLCWPIAGGSADYLDWIGASVMPEAPAR